MPALHVFPEDRPVFGRATRKFRNESVPSDSESEEKVSVKKETISSRGRELRSDSARSERGAPNIVMFPSPVSNLSRGITVG